nr:retrotransposon protein, putative, Ty1-copia subclass [Tanacetum cinerariifolium]
MGYSFYYPSENKVLVAQNVEFLENNLITQEASRSLEDLELIQEEDTHPSINIILNHEEDDLEIDEPQRDLGEPANYKVALLDPEFEKWPNAMNVKMQSMKDNEVWVLVELPPNGKTVDIRAIRILIVIAAYYDYEIWQMDVKTAFLNGYLNEEQMDVKTAFLNGYLNEKVYMEQPEDLGEATYIIGIKIYRDRSRWLIGLCQSAYIEKILKRYFIENSKRRSIPMQEKLKLSKSQGASTPAELKHMQNVPYASAIGSIMYVVRCTRPDVAFAQNVTSQFQQNPGDLHWTTVKNILKYLRNTKDMFLVYEGDLKREVNVSCYTDAGYPTDADDLKSQTRYVFVLIGGVVDWKRITKGARHFRAKVHYLREVNEYGDVKFKKVHIDDNLADPFTKALAFPKHSEHTRNIEMLPASSLM